jgi:acetyl esterase/lipase
MIFAFLAFVLTAHVHAEDQLRQNVQYDDVVTLQATNPDTWFKYSDDPLQYALVWQARDQVRADLVLIHGGCWLNSFDLNHLRPLASTLVNSGFNVNVIEYRRTGDPGGGWPGSLEDVLAAIDEVHTRQTSSVPLIVIGHSAGGHLALLAAAKRPEELHAAVGLAAIIDPGRYSEGSNSCQKATAGFFGGTPEDRADAYAQADLSQQTLHLQTVVLHGDADVIVPLDQIADIKAPKVIEPGAGHFDWIDPQARVYGVLLSTLDALLQ